MAETPASWHPSFIIVSTSIVVFISGFALGIYSIQGYLIPPAIKEERRRAHADPIESAESDVDEDSTILDHAPNWSNGEDADRRDGLRLTAKALNKRGKTKKAVTGGEGKLVDIDESPSGARSSSSSSSIVDYNPNEECKLVLVVRTDLGMTKGMCLVHQFRATHIFPSLPSPFLSFPSPVSSCSLAPHLFASPQTCPNLLRKQAR
jgi:PTH2 family peptidyl-tRNA hydrolase